MARRGYRVGLTSRREEELQRVRSAVKATLPQAVVEVAALDVCDYARVAPVLEALAQKLGGVDIICANAGMGSGGRLGDRFFEHHRKTIETNVIGAMATIEAAVKIFRAQKRGHIVAVSSVAAFRGLPTSAPYSASKAALSVLMEGLRAELYGTDIHTTTLYPGYIDTPINQHMGKNRPFLIDVEKGARICADLIEKRVVKSTVPVFPWNIVARLMQVLPTSSIARMGAGSRDRG
jgi:short-subunit dehydrogenase